MLTDVLTELEARRKDREADFLKLARRFAAGEKVPTAVVEKLLNETGKRPDELSAAVELATKRVRWHQERQAGTAAEKDRAAVENRIAAEDRKLAAAERAHENATNPLAGRLEEIKAAVSTAGNARRKLIETCPDVALKAELSDVTAQIRELHAKAAELRQRAELVQQADQDEEAARQIEAQLIPSASTAHIDERRELAQRKRKTGREAQAALPAVEADIAKAEREEADIVERMTAP